MEKTYVVIDVEMCQVRRSYGWKKYPYAKEIIQIGAVMMNEAYERIGEFSSYVCPAYGKINYFIQNLTGITQKDVRHAPSLDQVLSCMLGWIGERDVVFYAWSDTDYYQIRNEILAKGLDTGAYSLFLEEERWVDYQKRTVDRFELPHLISLGYALCITDLVMEGRAHDGLTDAYNTARLIEKMEKNPDSRFLLDRAGETEEEILPLGTSLGSLLSGLNLEIA